MDTSVSKDIRDRIWSAADFLYDQAGRGDVKPTVDAVRRHAKANMNDVSLVMKDWREAQKATVKSVAIEVPEPLAIMSAQTLGSMWQTAQDHANDSLRAAQAGWDIERMEADALARQISQAFDDQAAVLEVVERENLRLTDLSSSQAQQIQALIEQNQDLTNRLGEANHAASQAKVRAEEIESRAVELRKELDHAHVLAERVQAQAERDRTEHQKRFDDLKTERDEARQAHATELGKYQERLDSFAADRDAARSERDEARRETNSEREARMSEVGKLLEKVETLTQDRDEARKERNEANAETRAARENAAKLSGELEGMKTQIATSKKTPKT
ncbi:DNA-binding protein [Pseudomonas sp. CFBP 13602]|uniref:DNA-binding protein n=1 Tax=Pseudomonas sp. CFBP 13602 TaxID=2774039 RepID=UPI00177DE786|nr:DNA-binding protein [Pseudomonas sp. CFBP 13602]MBD8828996.1 DNA-binding protein [Pseudomonas sp. CFBP 13602]